MVGPPVEPMLVTLRAQVYQFIDLHFTYAVVCIENPEPVTGECSLRVLWQQVWGGTEATDEAGDYPLAAGLANAGQARVTTTEPVKNTYNWAVNALGIKAASRFQLPALDTNDDASGMGWRSTVAATDYELVEGELYHDLVQHAVMGRALLKWYVYVQPETFELSPGNSWKGGDPKNLLYTSGTAVTLSLSTTLSEVPLGSVVRVFNSPTSGINAITVQSNSTTIASVAVNKMAEFLFYIDGGGSGRWICMKTIDTAKG